MKRPPFFLLPTLGLLALATACGKDKNNSPDLSSAPVTAQNPDDPFADDLPPVNNTPLDPLDLKRLYTVRIKTVNDRLVDGYTKPIYVRPGDVVSLSADLYHLKSGEAQFRSNAEFSWKAQSSRETCHGYDPRSCFGTGFLVDDLNGVNFIVPFNFKGSMKLEVWWSRNDYRVASINLIAVRNDFLDPYFGLFPRWNPDWDRDGRGTHWNRNWDRNWNRQWNAPRERRWWKKEKRGHVITEPNPNRDGGREPNRDQNRERGDRREVKKEEPQVSPPQPQLPSEVKMPPVAPKTKGPRRQNEKSPREPLAPQPETTPMPAPVPEEKKPASKPERKQREEKPKKESEEADLPAPQKDVPAPNPPPEWIDEAPAAPTTPVEESAAPAVTPENEMTPAPPTQEETGDKDQPKKPRKQRQ